MDTERFWCPECESIQAADGMHSHSDCPFCGESGSESGNGYYCRPCGEWYDPQTN